MRRSDGSFTFAGELEVEKLTREFYFDTSMCLDLTITVYYLPLAPISRCFDPEFKILLDSGELAKLLFYFSSSSSNYTAFFIRSRLSCRSFFFLSSCIFCYFFSLEPSSSLSSLPLPPALENRDDLKSSSSSSRPGCNYSYYFRYR